MIFPETVWRIHKRDHTVYLTFDDGPIPEVTPWVLDTLDRYGIKATCSRRCAAVATAWVTTR